MEHAEISESEKCRLLAADMRLDATRTTIPGFGVRLIRGAEDLEELAGIMLALEARAILQHH